MRTHEQYFATIPHSRKALLQSIQQEVRQRIPDASPCISFGVPAFRQRHTFFYFAALSKHIGIYPPVKNDAALIAETARWRGLRGSLSFPLDEPLPLALIGRIAEALAAQCAAGLPALTRRSAGR